MTTTQTRSPELVVALGLEGIVATETVMSHIDGDLGRLVIRGYDVEDLAARVGFEAVCALLFEGELPRDATPMRQAIGGARTAAFARLDRSGDALDLSDPMDALRAALGHFSPRATFAETRLALAAAVPVVVAAWHRRRLGRDPVAPDESLSQAADYLRMLDGAPASPERIAALDTYLVTVADHGMNASTFTARAVASTRSDPVSAVVAAVGALKGPAHGGAPGPVLDMIEQIGTPEAAEGWLRAHLARGERIMGMGHRVYRTRDPRAAVLERAIAALERAGVAVQRLALAQAVERTALELLRERKPERALAANVEFYTAVLLDAIGLPADLFTPTFATARVAGWLAHVGEQYESGRLIRPRARYVGPTPVAA